MENLNQPHETFSSPKNRWTDDYRQAIKSHIELETFFECSFPKTQYPIFLPISVANKIKKNGLHSPLGLQFLPSEEENQDLGLADPIGDQTHQKTKQLIHRYHNRALFIPTQNCPVICRYCFRKNELYEEEAVFKQDLEETKSYLLTHPEIEEIIFTGGDPLMVSNEKIKSYLEFLATIPSIKYVRFHTRTPVIIPSRIDDELLTIFENAKKHFKRFLVMIHVNHLEEIGPEEVQAIHKLTHKHIELHSQTVLLKGVNDSAETLYDLFKALIDLNIHPYYLHHPDQVKGGMHFGMSLEMGRKIYQPLRDLLSGWAVPEYVIDIPGGDGKVNAFNPESYNFSGSLINKSGHFTQIYQ